MSWPRAAPLFGLLAALCLASVASGVGTAPAPPQPAARPRAAVRVIELPSGNAIRSEGEALLLRALQPGSTIKPATLIAALESDVISSGTRIPCPGAAVIGGERLACVHPRLGRPLRPAEALAYSCNLFFASVGRQLSRNRLNSTLAALGLPPVPPSAPMPLAAAGVRAADVLPSSLLQAWRRIVAEITHRAGGGVSRDPVLDLRPETGAVLFEGLRGAAAFGTASAFGARGIDALAKTGTALAAGGGSQGVALAAWPATAPRFAAIAIVPGGTGTDAAQVLAARAAAMRPDASAGASPAGRSTQVPPAPDAVEPAIRVGVPADGSRFEVRELPLEEYVARVLAGEAVPRSGPAALEALAITARTFALANRSRHARDGFDLCTLTHCQVLREPYAAVAAAAAATRGQILTWHGAPAGVYYTASCGGRTERPSAVWPGAADPPFLPVQPDEGCGGEPRWVSDIGVADLARALRAAGFRGDTVRDVRVRARVESGRVALLEIRGMAPDTITGQALRMAVGRTLGWHLLKSTAFDVRRSARGYRFAGRGFGHGVGFCVIGAMRRAEAGATRAALLEQYFPGTTLTTIDALADSARMRGPAAPAADLASGAPAIAARTHAPAGERNPGSSGGAAPRRQPPAVRSRIALVLPDGSARDRPMVLEIVERLLRTAASNTGESAPPRLQLVFHPSTASFRRQTSQPWWSAASTTGTRIDLQPVDVLRRRGVLESTIAHEIGHVVTARATAGRAAWVQEGAAMYAGGLILTGDARAVPADQRVSCPSDEELRRPRSAAAGRAAYARARDCFARALGKGTRWDQVR